MNVTLTLDLDSANDIVNVLGQLPTASGAFPLMQNVKMQIDMAVAASKAPAAEVEAPHAEEPAA